MTEYIKYLYLEKSDEITDECVICLNTTNIFSLPCHTMHKVCSECITKIDLCPYCRYGLHEETHNISPNNLTNIPVNNTNQMSVPLNFWFNEYSNNVWIPSVAIPHNNILIDIKLDELKIDENIRTDKISWTRKNGHSIIDSMEFKIDDVIIDKMDKNYIDLWNNFNKKS